MSQLSGAILAIDWGAKKIGIATSDPSGIAISPKDTIFREKNSPRWDLTKKEKKSLSSLIEDYSIEIILIGLPKNSLGEDNPACIGTKELAQKISHYFKLPIKLIDESLTSWEHKGKKNEDSLAAATLIKDFFSNPDYKNT